MKKILAAFFVLFFTSALTYAETINYGNGYFFEAPKRTGDIVTFTYKVTDIADLNTQLTKYDPSMQIGKDTVASVNGSITCDCKTKKAKMTTTFYDSNGGVVVSYAEPDYSENFPKDMIEELCNQVR